MQQRQGGELHPFHPPRCENQNYPVGIINHIFMMRCTDITLQTKKRLIGPSYHKQGE